jgi:hypothetical protein
MTERHSSSLLRLLIALRLHRFRVFNGVVFVEHVSRVTSPHLSPSVRADMVHCTECREGMEISW